MLLLRSVASRAARAPVRPQRRSFIDWMTNYPDRIVELKKHHQAGGRAIFTWQKQPQDIYTIGFGLAFATVGIYQLMVGHYRLATGKGKMDD